MFPPKTEAMLRFLKTLSLGSLVFLLFTATALASHLAGGEITYVSLGNDRYEISLKIFRDCNGITPANHPVTIQPISCGSSFTKTLQQVSIRNVTDICATLPSKCQGGSSIHGIEEWLFRDTIDLSTYTGCCNFNITWSQAGRPASITNVLANNLYLSAYLNKCAANSTPVFSGNLPIYCAGRDHCYYFGGRDTIDNDSLAYSLAESMDNATTAVYYLPAYTHLRPMMFLGHPNQNASMPAGFHIDPLSGDICFRPTKVEVGVVVIKVTEWRKISGTITKVGETRRDMMFTVIACSSNMQPTFNWSALPSDVCAGKQFCFDITSNDMDVNDTVRLSLIKSMPGATFTTSFPSGSSKEKATFCWTPADSDTLNGPHHILFSVKDNKCPVAGERLGGFQLVVKPPAIITATRQISKLGCGQVSFDATPSQGTPDYTWVIKNAGVTMAAYNQKNFIHRFAKGGTYIIYLKVDDHVRCPVEYTDTLEVDSFINVVLPPDTALCRNQVFQIVPLVSSGAPPYTYQWSSGINDTLPDLNIIVFNTVKYFLTVSDSNCSSADTILISRKAPSFVDAGSDENMCTDAGIFNLPGLPAGGSWSGTGITGNTFDPLLTGPGKFQLAYAFTDSGGCEGIDSASYTVIPLPIVKTGNDTFVCSGEILSLQAVPAGGSWSGPGVSGKYFIATTALAGVQTLVYTYSDTGGCSNTDTTLVDVKLPTVANAGPDTSVCTNAAIFPLYGSPAGGTWFGLGISGNTFNPAGITAEVTVIYQFTNNFGCRYDDPRKIKINLLPNVSAGSDQSMCKESGPVALHGIPAGGTWSGNGVNGNLFEPLTAGRGTHTLSYQVADSNGCVNTGFVKMNVVNPLAVFDAMPLSGQAPLTVTFMDYYNGSHSSSWDFGDPHDTASVFNLTSPSHVYTQGGMYTVRLAIKDLLTSCTDTLTKVNYINVSPTGIAEIGIRGIYAYPNPASKSFEVFVNTAEGLYTLSMHDISGKKVKEVKDILKGTIHVSCDELGAGMYFISLSAGSGEIYRTRIVLE
jgi:PKD repeat protein